MSPLRRLRGSALLWITAIVVLAGGVWGIVTCSECSTGIPWWLPGLSFLGWTVAAWQSRKELILALTICLTLTSGHITIMWLASGVPCILCIVALAIQLVSCIWMATRVTGVFKRIHVAYCVVAIATGGVSMLLLLTVFLPPSEDRVLGGASSEVKAYVVMNRGCTKCEKMERVMAEAIASGLSAETVFVDARSTLGRTLTERANLSKYPSFVAFKGGKLIHSQNGGSLDTFVGALAK